MKGIMSAITRRARRIIVRMGYERARSQLLQLSDHTLDDIGVSRALLQQGVEAWPWREQNPAVAAHSTTRQDLKLAVAELRCYSDAELKDLGIARSQIETVVVNGREGIDTPPYNAAA